MPNAQGSEQRVRPEDALSLLLKSLHVTASPYLDSTRALTAALAVPHDLSDSARALLVASARSALPSGARIALVADAHCVALAYGLTETCTWTPMRVCVVDFGSVLRLSELSVLRGVVRIVRAVTVDEVRACALEKAVVEHWAGEAARKLRVDLATLLSSARAKAKLSAEVVRVLRVLGNAAETAVSVEGLIDGLDFTSTLTRAKCDALCDPTWRRAQSALRAFAQEAEGSFARVLVSGGHGKLTRISTLLSAVFEPSVLTASADLLDPLTVVATGAALHARSLLRASSPPLAQTLTALRREANATTRAIGVRVRGTEGVAHTVVPRDCPLPLLRRVRLRLPAAGSADFAPHLLEIVEGEYYEPLGQELEGEGEVEDEGEGEGEAEGGGEGDSDAYMRVLVRLKVPSTARHVDLALRLDERANLVPPHVAFL